MLIALIVIAVPLAVSLFLYAVAKVEERISDESYL
jgi:hypothetical protein